MKKFFSLVGLSVIAVSAFAQLPESSKKNITNNLGGRVRYQTINFGTQNFQNVDKAMNPFYIDYGAYAGDDGGFVWAFNSNYAASDTTGAAGVTPVNYAAVKLTEPFGGYYDAGNIDGSKDIIIDYPNLGIRVDSIFWSMTHENNTGTYNKITQKIVELNTSGNPTATSPVMWSNTDSTNVGISPCGNWLGTGCGVTLFATPGYVIPPGKKGAIVIDYLGAKQDTFSLIATYLKDPADPNKATKSLYETSYTRIPPFIPNITKNANIGYGNPVGSNGWFEAQNWAIWAFVTLMDDVSVEEAAAKGISASRAFPNPASTVSTLEFTLTKAAKVEVSITDITGKVVRTYALGDRSIGKHNFILDMGDLTNGVYSYSLTANGVRISDKIIVAK